MSANYSSIRSRWVPGLWCSNREASLNWLALGLLLAAWNATSEEVHHAPRRPDALRGYSYVSVRAAQRSAVSSSTST
jgi:hypothetical protein